jgi:hypothetical protein
LKTQKTAAPARMNRVTLKGIDNNPGYAGSA